MAEDEGISHALVEISRQRVPRRGNSRASAMEVTTRERNLESGTPVLGVVLSFSLLHVFPRLPPLHPNTPHHPPSPSIILSLRKVSGYLSSPIPEISIHRNFRDFKRRPTYLYSLVAGGGCGQEEEKMEGKLKSKDGSTRPEMMDTKAKDSK